MPLKITTLIENSRGEHLGLKTEHGISFCIEKDGSMLLFDAGQTDAFLYNAAQLNLDLRRVEKVILSHGHYDHTGGLMALADINDDFKLFLGNGFFEEKYGYRNHSYEYLGNNFIEADLTEKNIKHSFIESRKTDLGNGIFIITDFIRSNTDETINSRFKLKKNNRFVSDPFNDEILIAIETPLGMVVLLGCSHPGVKNMIDTVYAEFDKPVYAVLGGTHLVEASGDNLEMSIKYLSNDNIKILGVSHCTGVDGMKRLEREGSSFFHNSTGSSIFLDY